MTLHIVDDFVEAGDACGFELVVAHLLVDDILNIRQQASWHLVARVDGKLIYGQEGNGEPDGIFKFSSNEIAGETGAQGKPDDPKYKNYLNYYILGYNKEMHITLGNDFLTGEKLNISVWLGLEDMPEFKSNTITFYTY